MAENKKNVSRASTSKKTGASNASGTKNAASKKPANRKPESKSMDRALKNTILGIAFLALALVSFLSFFDGVMGLVGTALRTAMSWAMGATAAGIPILFLFLAISRIIDRHTKLSARGWCLIGLYGILSVFWSVLSVPLNGMGLVDYLTTLANKGIQMSGGGTLTGILAWGCLSLLNKIGSIIVLIAVALILLVVISGVTFAGLFDRENKSEEEPEPTPAFVLPFGRKKKTLEKEPEPVTHPKRKFTIPSVDPEETLTPAARRKLQTEQRERESQIGMEDPDPTPGSEPIPEYTPAKRDVILSTEFRGEGERKPKKKKDFDFSSDDLLKTPQQLDDETRALMASQADDFSSIDPDKITKEEITSEAGQMAEEIKKDAEAERPYVYPPLSLLNFKPDETAAKAREELRQTAEKLMQALDNFSVNTTYLDAVRGPTVTRYELQPNAGVKISKIVNLTDDIALHLAASGIRIEAPIPGRSAIGIEIPNKVSSMVYLKETISSDAFRTHKSNIAVALGKDISGQNICIDLAKMPHLLIAGSTGSGKSVCINTLLMSILYKSSPEQVKLILIDPKQVELSVYNGIPHLLVPVVTEAKKAAGALQWAVTEMEQRYKLFTEKKVRNFQGYNEKLEGDEKPLPQIVIIIDELADLMMVAPGEVEESICRLAQMARAAGMHIVIATQRPSADVLTGLIKTNVPSRIAFAVSSGIDSRIILDQTGAEKLIGRGDMLYNPLGAPKPMRIQGCFVDDDEIERVVNFIKEHTAETNAERQAEILKEIEKRAKESIKGTKKGIVGQNDLPGGTDEDGDLIDFGDDVLLPRAVEVVLKAKMASTSGLQRSLGVGHSRAGRIMDQMEKKGYIGPYQGSKPREVLITQEQWNEICATASEGDET